MIKADACWSTGSYAAAVSSTRASIYPSRNLRVGPEGSFSLNVLGFQEDEAEYYCISWRICDNEEANSGHMSSSEDRENGIFLIH